MGLAVEYGAGGFLNKSIYMRHIPEVRERSRIDHTLFELRRGYPKIRKAFRSESYDNAYIDTTATNSLTAAVEGTIEDRDQTKLFNVLIIHHYTTIPYREIVNSHISSSGWILAVHRPKSHAFAFS